MSFPVHFLNTIATHFSTHYVCYLPGRLSHFGLMTLIKKMHMTIFAIDLFLYLFLGTNIIISTLFSDTLKQWCTNPERQFATTTEYFALAPNICGPSVWNLLMSLL